MLRNVLILLLPQSLLLGLFVLQPGPALWALLTLWSVSQILVLQAHVNPRSRLFAPTIWRCAPQPRIALTFDDGPHPVDTSAILDVLSRTGVHATFFFVASRARNHPGLVRRVAQEGHEIGVHSDTHPWWFSLAGPGRTQKEVQGATRILESITGSRPRHFRPPMGHKNIFLRREIPEARLELATWTVRGYDKTGPSPTTLQKRIMKRIQPGGIILLHEGVRRRYGSVSPTLEALEGIINSLKTRGLEPVSLETLRSDRMTDPHPRTKGAYS